MTRYEMWGVSGIGEVQPGDDLAALIVTAEPTLRDGDIVVVTSKVVSKAEGRVVQLDRDKAIDDESVRVVAARGATRIVETRHGFVLAAAGVDASNVPDGTVALLPEDPDASARAIRAGIRERLGVQVGVVVTDTFGRPWRNGLVDVAVGAAGVRVLDDHRGRVDGHGHTLEMTVTAVADEIAAAAELVKGKLAQVPVAVVRGLDVIDADGTARDLVRPAADDMFRLGTREAAREAVTSRREPRAFAPDDVDGECVRAAVRAALGSPSPAPAPWQFVDTTAVREELLDVLGGPARLLRSAPVLLLMCAAGGDWDGTTTELLSAGAAIERFLVVAHADGYASGWRDCTAAAADVRRTLDLTEDLTPLAVIGVGRAR